MRKAAPTPAALTAAGAALADESGFAQLSVGRLAKRLGAKAPPLYTHVTNQAELGHRIATLAHGRRGDSGQDRCGLCGLCGPTLTRPSKRAGLPRKAWKHGVAVVSSPGPRPGSSAVPIPRQLDPRGRPSPAERSPRGVFRLST
jgi:hypothetical protein